MAIDPARVFKPIRIAVLTVSDTRTAADDTSGDLLVERIGRAGHTLAARAIERDEVGRIVSRLSDWIDDRAVDCVISTGGTGLTGRDVTPEAFDRIKASHDGRDIPGFGELFRWLSFDEIGTSTIQSRAEAALCGSTFVFLLPGSTGGVRTALEKILIPQLDHRLKPCNFVMLLPRIKNEPTGRA